MTDDTPTPDEHTEQLDGIKERAEHNGRVSDGRLNAEAEPLQTYERQAGKNPDVPGSARFTDLNNRAEWRPPNMDELETIRRKFTQSIDGVHIAVIDGYQSDTPGYAGPLAVLVGGDVNIVETVPLRIHRGDVVDVWDLDTDDDRIGENPTVRGKVEGIATEAGRRGYEIRDEMGNLVTVWERADREISVSDGGRK